MLVENSPPTNFVFVENIFFTMSMQPIWIGQTLDDKARKKKIE